MFTILRDKFRSLIVDNLDRSIFQIIDLCLMIKILKLSCDIKSHDELEDGRLKLHFFSKELKIAA
jgi:hypothetical protein